MSRVKHCETQYETGSETEYEISEECVLTFTARYSLSLNVSGSYLPPGASGKYTGQFKVLTFTQYFRELPSTRCERQVHRAVSC